MSGSRNLFTTYLNLISICLCLLHFCISDILDGGRQRRYTEGDICFESQKTIEEVEFCPDNIEKFNKQSNKKNCKKYELCSGQPLHYHCVFDVSKGQSVEVCAPLDIITGRCCASYDVGLGRVIENYNKPCSQCPFQYPSNCFNYSECVWKSEPNEDKAKHDQNLIHIIVLTGILFIGFSICLVIALVCRKKLKRVCCTHEDCTKSIKDKEDYFETHTIALVCNEELKRVCCTHEDCTKSIKDKEDLFETHTIALLCNEGREELITEKCSSLQRHDSQSSFMIPCVVDGTAELKRVCCTHEDCTKSIKDKEYLFKTHTIALVCNEGREELITEKCSSL